MEELIRVWQPKLRGEYSTGLSVRYDGNEPPNRSQFLDALEDRLAEQIAADPRQAKHTLMMSVEHSPNLYEIGRSSRQAHWPQQIVMCDQMQVLLRKINLEQGRSALLPKSEMPSLAETLELI